MSLNYCFCTCYLIKVNLFTDPEHMSYAYSVIYYRNKVSANSLSWTKAQNKRKIQYNKQMINVNSKMRWGDIQCYHKRPFQLRQWNVIAACTITSMYPPNVKCNALLQDAQNQGSQAEQEHNSWDILGLYRVSEELWGRLKFAMTW